MSVAVIDRQKQKWARRERRVMRVRKKIFGTKERPRLCVYRSLNHFYAQIIDDMEGKTLVAISTADKDVKSTIKSGGNVHAAAALGAKFAEIAKSKGIGKVVFDRRSYKFHGRVKAFADAIRKCGIKF